MANKKSPVSSKFLSLVLRHKPELIGLKLDKAGWAKVEDLITQSQIYGKDVDLQMLESIVALNEKKRFSFSEDRRLIRANQGHSVKVDLGYISEEPPAILFHGTAAKNISSILSSGLQKRNRHHVHLSLEEETALKVGRRHGKPVIFKIMAGEMFKNGYKFYVSDNGVWLTDEVPVEFLQLRDEQL